MIRYTRFKTPLGIVIATAAGAGLTAIHFVDEKHAPKVERGWIEDDQLPALRECAKQVCEYLDGKRKKFDLPLAPEGSDFQRRVWIEIARIPYGKTISYAQLAERAGAPGSARAAGAATGRNPLAMVVPCHRVVGSDGSLTGYAGGIERKAKMLEMEGALKGALI